TAIAYGGGTATATYHYDQTSGVLTVIEANGEHVDLNIGTGYAGAHFAGSDDGHGGTLITLNAEDDAPAFVQDSVSASLSEHSDVSQQATIDSVGGTLGFTDVDMTDRPVVSVLSQTVVDGNGNAVSLTQAELTALESALKLTPHAGNANNGAVDWSYSI